MADWRRILVVRLGDLGDMLLAEPALRSLQAGHPDARIDLLTSPAARPVADLLGVSGDVLQLERRPGRSFADAAGVTRQLGSVARVLARRQFDAVVLLHHLTTRTGALRLRLLARAAGAPRTFGLDNGRGSFLTHSVQDHGFGERHEVEYALAVAQAAGGADVDPEPRLASLETVRPEWLPRAEIVIGPVSGSYAPGRDWPVDRYQRLVESIVTEHPGSTIAIAGDRAATAAGACLGTVSEHVHDLTGRTSIQELMHLVARARLVIANDSFPGHLAAAMGTPVVAIFGPSNESAWRPYHASQESGSVRVVSAEFPCSPCLYTGHSLGRRFGCPTRTCLTSMDVATVMAAVRETLGEVH